MMRFALKASAMGVLAGMLSFLPLRAADTSVFTVTTTRDSGSGSLREALALANRTRAPKTIGFNIPKSDPGFSAKLGTWTITFRDTPPAITSGNLLLNGTSQSSNQGDLNPHGPEIILSGDRHSVECAFVLVNVSNVTVRGFAICEFIYGIQVYGLGSQHNRIVGNYVGVTADGTEAAGNYNGIELLSGTHDNIVGGAALAERNLVSGNEHIGIRMSDANRNFIFGNYVGLDRTGTRAVPNHDGICVEGRSRGNVIGGAKPGERNIASGNVAYGLDLFGVGVQENLVFGNYLGTDVTGTKAVPNTYGVLFDDRASRNAVGGTNTGEWNLISGNTAFGAYFYNNGTCSNVVQGNRIGTDASGTVALPNETGVHIDGGTFRNVVDRNVISGNLVAGVTVFARYTDHNIIRRNLIGTDLTGTSPLGNGADGVRIAFGPQHNRIGGSPAEGNVIAHNGKNGVSVESDEARFNRVTGNSIFQNRAMGIDLFPEGPNTPRPALGASGPNGGINAPVIETARVASGECLVRGRVLLAQPTTASVELFLSSSLTTSPQGNVVLGVARPATDGRWQFRTRPLNRGDLVTATVTDAQGNTSEFSNGVKTDYQTNN